VRPCTRAKAIRSTDRNLPGPDEPSGNYRGAPSLQLDVALQRNLPKQIPLHAAATTKHTASGLPVEQVTSHQAPILIIHLAATDKTIDIGT